jgi:hypothetical protein
MEKNQVRLRINLESREFEVEGDAGYINERFGDEIDEYLSMIKKGSRSRSQSQPESSVAKQNLDRSDVPSSLPNINMSMPDSFGEYFSKYPKGIGIVDKLLIASYYVQSNNTEKVFTLKEATDLLLAQGVKLSNPNAFNKANRESKRIFNLTGKNYRVSESGVEYLNGLMTE